jgi:hypothetical protein
MTDTPETDYCIKESKHISFLEEDHWSLNGNFTYTPPIVELCRRLERQRDAWKAKFILQNKELGCEMMDPNGTIWDYAKKLQKDLDAAIAKSAGISASEKNV